MLAITNATLVMRDHFIPNGVILVENGLIKEFGPAKNVTVPADCQILDAGEQFVGPGLVDIHTHSNEKDFFQDKPEEVAKTHLMHGATSVLPALYFSMNTKEYVAAINTLKEAMKKPECANIAGLYMEGPYMNPKFGGNRENNPWKGPIKKEDYLPILEAGADVVKVWALAPEREHILDFVLDAKKYNPSVAFSVAHSEAPPEQIEALMPYGLRIGTHHTNATGNIVKYSECRGVCVDETVNYNSEIYAELICDSLGMHVDPYMLRLIRKIKGENRIILISDSYACDGPVPEGYEDAFDINFDHSGEIAGSRLTLDIACANMMKHTGASIVDVFRYASYNPAKAVGFYDRGEIAVGKRADLLVVDYKMNIKNVILKGEVQK